jgi:hypothetical protein
LQILLLKIHTIVSSAIQLSPYCLSLLITRVEGLIQSIIPENKVKTTCITAWPILINWLIKIRLVYVQYVDLRQLSVFLMLSRKPSSLILIDMVVPCKYGTCDGVCVYINKNFKQSVSKNEIIWVYKTLSELLLPYDRKVWAIRTGKRTISAEMHFIKQAVGYAFFHSQDIWQLHWFGRKFPNVCFQQKQYS